MFPMNNRPTHAYNIDQNCTNYLEKLDYAYKVLCPPIEFDYF